MYATFSEIFNIIKHFNYKGKSCPSVEEEAALEAFLTSP
jgi:hypothetical protein